ncbi:hypothetical protein BDW75DRAFT_200317 [Aspergillus navahoensis]
MEYDDCLSFNPIPHRSEGRYMDPRKLVQLLRDQYGPSNFRIHLQRDQYHVYVHDKKFQSSRPSDEDINKCRQQY